MTTKAGRPTGMTAWVVGAGLVMAAATAASYGLIPGLDRVLELPRAEASGAPKTDSETTAETPADAKSDIYAKEAELAAREAKLKEQEQTVAALSNALSAQEAEANGVKRAVGVYAAMPPFKAGPMLEALEPAMAVEILRQLDHDQAAAILSYMEPAQASSLTAQLMRPDKGK
jgi:flagellar motility protein MotE (MotC chaperone)